METSLTERIKNLRSTPSEKLKKRGQHMSRLEALDLDKRWKALQLRHAGATYRQIGESLGVSAPTAQDYVQWALDQVIEEPAADVLALELQRLDTLQMSWWAKAQNDTKAAELVMKIMATRQRLLGIDKPKEADMQFIFGQASIIAAQLGIPVEDVLAQAEYIAQQAFLQETPQVESPDGA